MGKSRKDAQSPTVRFLNVLTTFNRQEQVQKALQSRKEEVKLFMFADDLRQYTVDPNPPRVGCNS